MAEDYTSHEDDAVLYVLNRLPAAERQAFEIRLAESAALRDLVRELESGTIALTFAQPQHIPPREAWETIENRVNRDTRSSVGGFLRVWLKAYGGWTAAAICALGWFLHAVSAHRTSSPGEPSPQAIALSSDTIEQQPNAMGSNSSNAPSANSLTAPSRTHHLLAESSAEVLRLRGQLSALQTQLRSQSADTSPPAEFVDLPGTTRLSVFQLSPPGAAVQSNALPPAELQQALLLALARQLGWITGTNLPSADAETGKPLNGPVNFVDLAPGSATPPAEKLDSESSADANPAAAPSVVYGAFPIVASDTSVLVALNSSLVPPGTSQVGLWSNSTGELRFVGWVPVSDGATVASIPWSGNGLNAFTLYATVSSGTQTFIIGQYPPSP